MVDEIKVEVEKLTVQERVRQVYDDLSEKSPDGGVTAHQILEASRPEDAPLHSQFTWNDGAAAKKHRVDEARKLLRLIQIEYLPGKKTRELQSLVINIENKNERKYYKVEKILTDKNLKKRAIKQILKELRSLVDKYKSYKVIYQLVNDGELTKLEQEILTI
jgi:hypothetical protein